MKKFPVAKTRTLCLQGALLHAVRLLRRNWFDDKIAARLDMVYGCGTPDQYEDIIRLARQGMLSAEMLVELGDTDPIDKILIPQIPGY